MESGVTYISRRHITLNLGTLPLGSGCYDFDYILLHWILFFAFYLDVYMNIIIIINNNNNSLFSSSSILNYGILIEKFIIGLTIMGFLKVAVIPFNPSIIFLINHSTHNYSFPIYFFSLLPTLLR